MVENSAYKFFQRQRLRTTVPIRPNDLESVLKTIPGEPTSVEVVLYRVLQQEAAQLKAESIVPGIKLIDLMPPPNLLYPNLSGVLAAKLHQPTKAQIVQFYSHSYGITNGGSYGNPRIVETPRIDLQKATWVFNDGNGIEVAPTLVEVRYDGQEPDYLAGPVAASKLSAALVVINGTVAKHPETRLW